jgi:hypothetical protein
LAATLAPPMGKPFMFVCILSRKSHLPFR